MNETLRQRKTADLMHQRELEDFADCARQLGFDPDDFEITFKEVSAPEIGRHAVQVEATVRRGDISFVYPTGLTQLFPIDALQDIKTGKFGAP